MLKPPGWEFSIEGIHRLVKDYISMHCMVDMTAQGGATAAQFMKSINELWARSPVDMGADKFLLRVAVLCWTCNDVAGKNQPASTRDWQSRHKCDLLPKSSAKCWRNTKSVLL